MNDKQKQLRDIIFGLLIITSLFFTFSVYKQNQQLKLVLYGNNTKENMGFFNLLAGINNYLEGAIQADILPNPNNLKEIIKNKQASQTPAPVSNGVQNLVSPTN